MHLALCIVVNPGKASHYWISCVEAPNLLKLPCSQELPECSPFMSLVRVRQLMLGILIFSAWRETYYVEGIET